MQSVLYLSIVHGFYDNVAQQPILRPSIEELLHHPQIQAPTKPHEEIRRVSPPCTEALSARDELLKKEEALRTKEMQLNEREIELDAREKRLELRENMAKEKLSRSVWARFTR